MMILNIEHIEVTGIITFTILVIHIPFSVILLSNMLFFSSSVKLGLAVTEAVQWFRYETISLRNYVQRVKGDIHFDKKCLPKA